MALISIAAKPRPLMVLALLVTCLVFTSLGLGLSTTVVRAVAPHQGDVYVGQANGLVGHYTSQGAHIETLDSTSGSTESTGMCFDAAADLYSTQFNAGVNGGVSKFDPTGALIAAQFGSGYNQQPESCVVTSANQILVGQADGSHKVLRFNSSGTLLNTYAPTVDPGGRGTDWIDLAPDQCTIYYTGEGRLVQTFNVCNNVQGQLFATAPLGAECFAHRLLPNNGGLIAACNTNIYRFDGTGTLAHTYPAASLTPAPTGRLFALNLDPDGSTFWTADDGSGQVYRVNIASGAQLSTFNAGSAFGLAIAGETVPVPPTPSPTPSQTPTPTPPLPAPPVTGRG